ncbi:MAG: response regulator [Chloroflexi bacterium]|nr:response regulator [Chloroflexota bacterium]
MRTVFIVDDDREMARAVKMLFKLLDFEAETFPNARDFARRLLDARSLPDLLMLDLNIPQVSGLDVLEWLRKTERFRDIPTIVLSSETYPRLVDHVTKAGANAYLFKPVTLEELEKAVKKVLPKLP